MKQDFLKLHENKDNTIQEFRTADAVLKVTENGKPLANREIEISQIRHKFLFGSNAFKIVPLSNEELKNGDKEKAEVLNKMIVDLFNFVTLPFYWGRFEPKKGMPDTERLLNAAKWFTDRGCTVKGHTLCWHTLCADWLMEMTNEEILKTQLDRIRREVRDFKGFIDIWDVVNEAVIMPIFDKYDNGMTRVCKELGRIQTIRKTFEAARMTDPKAKLILNDFDLSIAYEILIEGCIESGIKIDVLGLQSHMHQGFWGIEKTQKILDRYSRFDLPIHFSEVTLLSGDLMPKDIVDLNDFQVKDWPSTPEGEARQAEETVSFYKTLFSHPKVEGITWWDPSDGCWLNAPAGLIKKDNAPKPAYLELMKLIKGEWWVKPSTIKTDSEGKICFNGFLGDYSVKYGDKKAVLNLNNPGILTPIVSF
jgi:GH35 family endo-1,4-beta-xylanase